MKVHCRTNLDVRECWPCDLPTVPRVGDLIQSSIIWNGVFQLTLKVVEVTWKKNEYTGEWYAEVELHDSWPSRSISDFYKWYCPLIGKSVSAFI